MASRTQIVCLCEGKQGKGPRVKHDREVANAARNLASMCRESRAVDNMPPSLQWSCKNWRALVERMRKS